MVGLRPVDSAAVKVAAALGISHGKASGQMHSSLRMKRLPREGDPRTIAQRMRCGTRSRPHTRRILSANVESTIFSRPFGRAGATSSYRTAQ
ncbi:hypothetical protein MB901379_02856 [Mycobacterium basiliense]|uniref:Uncharacterized protein n=1 Tax=Mycobacterium basiliense TaxID=2094119 RepID=A0A447GFN4_9MYCO|nr:hypothetical protein MB901379_02856 [Mycobacterium basiliense]